MKLPYPVWKWCLVFMMLVMAVHGLELVLGVQWPKDEPHWKRIVYNVGEMLLGVGIAWMGIKNWLVERFNQRQELLDTSAKINLLFKTEFTTGVLDDENRGTS